MGQTPARFAVALRGRTILRVTRRGKYIVIVLNSGQHLLIHLRMTGKFRFAKTIETPGTHDHVVFSLSDGRRLFFNDTRKFGRLRLASAAEDGLGDLGPEPLDNAFTSQVLRARMKGKTRMIKPLLLDQTCVAGLGNIYVDESLWQAKIHPQRRADSLTASETRKLHQAIREVLQRAVENCGTTLGAGETNFYGITGRSGHNADSLKVFRRTGKACPRCGNIIVRTVIGQRGTHLCPSCQIP